jgi:hypothetical protein
MPGSGPRVGGAHVDVNLKFDDKSLDAFAKRIHQQLASIGKHNREVYRSIGRESVAAWRAALGATLAAAPLMGSAISGLSGAATMLAGSLYSVGQSSSALLPIFTSLGVAGLALKVGMRGFGAAVSEVDPKRLQLLLKDMPKSMQQAVLATRKLSNEMRDAVWPKLFAGLSDGINSLRETGVIQRGLGLMANSLNGLAKSVLNYANSQKGVKTLNTFFENNAQVFAALSKVAVPFLDGFLRLINALSPAAIRLAGYIEDIAIQFQKWTKGAGFGKRIDDSMKGAQKTAGLLWKILGNLGAALSNVFNAANPATNTFLQMLVDVTQRFQDWTDSVGGQDSIAKWAAQSVDVMRQFGHTMEAVFKVIAELADPRVITSFLATVEGAFNLLGKLPLDKIVSAFVTVSEALQPVSSFFLAIIISGAAFNILLGSLMGQLGGLVSIISGFKSTGDLFKNLENVGKHRAEVGRFATVLRGLGSILSKVLKFAGFVGFAVYIASLILQSDKLKGKVVDVFDAFKGLWEPLKNAFSEIKTALDPVVKGLSPIFDLLDAITSLAIGVVLDVITIGFKSLGLVIEGAGHIIAGFINVLVGLFTLDFGKVWDGLKQMASGLGPLLRGMFGMFTSFLSASGLMRVGLDAMNGLWSGIKSATPKILAVIGRFLSAALGFFAGLPVRLFLLGIQSMSRLRSAFQSGLGALRGVAITIVASIVGIIASLPGKLLHLGGSLLSAGKTLGGKILDGIRSGLTAIGDMAGGVASSLKAGINNAIGLPKNVSIDVLGKKIGFTIPGFEKGGIAPGGPIVVGEGGIEILSPPRGSRIHTNAQAKKMMGSGLPKTVILRIGARDFVAYVEEVADNRISASDNLAWQGA